MVEGIASKEQTHSHRMAATWTSRCPKRGHQTSLQKERIHLWTFRLAPRKNSFKFAKIWNQKIRWALTEPHIKRELFWVETRWGLTALIQHWANPFIQPRWTNNHNRASNHTRKSHRIDLNIKSSLRRKKHRLGLLHGRRRHQGGQYRHTLEIETGLPSAQPLQSRYNLTPAADLWTHTGLTLHTVDPTTHRWILNILQLQEAQRKWEGQRWPTPSHRMTS